MKILVASCDKNKDLFEPFHHCLEKYWPNHPEVIYSTETIKNPYYKTICKNYSIEKWTTRIKETAREIDDRYILLMCDDIFLIDYVDDFKVNSLIKYFDKNTASINLHKSGDPNNIKIDELVSERSEKGNYKTSVMCSLWKKWKLLKVFNWDADPWKFETANIHRGYRYLSVNDLILKWGYNWKGDIFGVYRGKWVKKTVNFLNKEGLNIDYSKRGYYD